MKKKHFYKTITSLLITSFILIPIAAIPKKAEAQSVAGFASGLLPAITKLPMCKNKINNVIGSLFNRVPALNLDPEAMKKISDETGKAVAAMFNEDGTLNDAVGAAMGQQEGVQTYSPEELKKLNEIQAITEKTKKITEELNNNDTCFKSIGRLVTKMLLQKITISTVAWINSGFDGKPAFIQDSGKFFNDIAKNEILQFGLEINNPELFPFGKQWMMNQASAFNNKFADNARYSLDEMIQKSTPQFSAMTFSQDFSQGGWDAWTAMTQYPQNNPLGFQLMADNEIQQRLAGTTASVAENTRQALQAANGFLGDERCADPVGLTKALDKKGLELRAKGDKNAVICDRWEYVTPGKLISEAATSTIKYPENNLLKAEDLNDAIAAVMDALLSRFSSDLMEKGYANLSNDGADGSFVYNSDSERPDYSSQTQKDFTPGQLTSSWLTANPEFNIRTDLTQALIDEQRTYSDKLALQNKELNSTTDEGDYKMENGVSNAYGLIPAIDQLDYCIPGPHPGFEDDSRNTLDAVTNVIRPLIQSDVGGLEMAQIGTYVQSLAPLIGAAIFASVGTFTVMGMTIGSAVPVVGTIIGAAVGAIVGVIAKWIFGSGQPKAAEKLRYYYYLNINSLVGVVADYTSDRLASVGSFMTKGGAVQTLNVILERYINLVHLIYNPKVLPDVYREATVEYYKLKGYAQMIKNNDDSMALTKQVVTTLGDIKTKIEDLNMQYPNGGDAYENELKAQISAFGRISANMVNGDDIANADSLWKQILDEKNYVYNDLLKGPYGCEKQLEGPTSPLPAQLVSTKRMTYPFALIYTYDMAANSDIPDPWKSGFINKTNANATNAIGPGFLSAYQMQTEGLSANLGVMEEPMTKWRECVTDENGAVPINCELETRDILPLWTKSRDKEYQGPRYIGTGPTPQTSGVWEAAIGVY